jgi:hypothetical protein
VGGGDLSQMNAWRGRSGPAARGSPEFTFRFIAVARLGTCALNCPGLRRIAGLSGHHRMKTDSAMSTALQSPVSGFLDAINRNDTDAFLACFPADGVVDDWGTKYVGHARIKAWSDREFIGVQVKLTVVSVKQTGNEVSIGAQVGGNGFTGPSRFVVVVDGQQVREMRITAH